MITKLSIRNFKSIKELDIDCSRVNLFIGEPNTGKSNILEALGLLSWCGSKDLSLNEFVRFQYTSNLFYDNLINQIVDVYIATESMLIYINLVSTPASNTYTVYSGRERYDSSLDKLRVLNLKGESFNTIINSHSDLEFIKFYQYKQLEGDKFPDKSLSTLVHPYGSNMLSLISTTKKHRETLSLLFKDFGLKPLLREHEDSIEFIKEVDDTIFNYPYALASDTLRRMIFYNIAIDSNKDSTIIFEEPEIHAFPAYIKQLGEKIALDESNQYFIVTHNPYLFLSIVEKTPKDNVNVFITYMKNYQTKVKRASSEEISDLMDYDPFFNLRAIIEENDNDSD